MAHRRRFAAALVAALALASCARGGTSVDEELNAEVEAQQAAEEGASGSSAAEEETTCGNGVINTDEECDRSNLNGATCQTLGFTGGGALGCDPVTCTYDASMCRMAAQTPTGNPPVGGTGG
jgi:hypothetical protein